MFVLVYGGNTDAADRGCGDEEIELKHFVCASEEACKQKLIEVLLEGDTLDEAVMADPTDLDAVIEELEGNYLESVGLFTYTIVDASVLTPDEE